MNHFRFFLFLVIVLFIACEPIQHTHPVDIKAEETALNELIEQTYTLIENKDIQSILNFYADDAVFLGSDPSEKWNKKQMEEMWKQIIADTLPPIKFISEKLIKVSEDGNTAVVVDQFIMPLYSDKLPFRNVYTLSKKDGKWMINFLNTSCIPKNEDIPKINTVLE